MAILIERLATVVILFTISYFFVYRPLKEIFKPTIKKFQAQQRVRIAEAELEEAKAERQITEIELETQDEINKTIDTVTRK